MIRSIVKTITMVMLCWPLSSCFEMTIYSQMSSSGLVNNKFSIVTNAMFAGTFNDTVRKLREEGKNVSVNMDQEGNVIISWQSTGLIFNEVSCSGIWLWKKCHARHVEAIPEQKNQQMNIYSDILMNELYPVVNYYFDMPKDNYIKSNADKVTEPEKGVYRMYWGRKTQPGQKITFAIDYKP